MTRRFRPCQLTAFIMTDPLAKARQITLVRKQYEDAETREERIRLARLLESLYTPRQ